LREPQRAPRIPIGMFVYSLPAIVGTERCHARFSRRRAVMIRSTP
jgi:hypothetical protein